MKNGPGEIRDEWRPANRAQAAELLASLGAQSGTTAGLESGSCHR